MIPSRDTLTRLCANRKTAIVTGRPLKDALTFLNRFGLDELFQELITMEDAPAKPSPDPVNLALARLGVERAWISLVTQSTMYEQLEVLKSFQSGC